VSMTVTELLRARIKAQINLPVPKHQREKISTEISSKKTALYEVTKLAAERMEIGGYRYGLLPSRRGTFLDRMKNKIKYYENTHNKEMLIDIINYAVREYMEPMYEDAYFAVDERGISSGRHTGDI